MAFGGGTTESLSLNSQVSVYVVSETICGTFLTPQTRPADDNWSPRYLIITSPVESARGRSRTTSSSEPRIRDDHGWLRLAGPCSSGGAYDRLVLICQAGRSWRVETRQRPRIVDDAAPQTSLYEQGP